MQSATLILCLQRFIQDTYVYPYDFLSPSFLFSLLAAWELRVRTVPRPLRRYITTRLPPAVRK
jgi:hypothetical protein